MTDDDKIIIPIEIETQGLQDLSAINQQIDEIDKKSKSILPAKRGSDTGLGRSPIQSIDTSEGFGIFAGERTERATPSKFKDRTSKQAFSREDSFTELKRQVAQMEQVNKQLTSTLAEVAAMVGYNIPFLGSGLHLFRSGKRQATKLMGNSQAPFNAAKSPKGYARMGGILKGLGQHIPFVGFFVYLADVIINELPEIMKEELYGPGKLFDRRFKREINKEILLHQERLEKAEKRQGFREVRITTAARLRGGAGQVGGNLYDLSRGGSARIPSNFIDSKYDEKPSSYGAIYDRHPYRNRRKI